MALISAEESAEQDRPRAAPGALSEEARALVDGRALGGLAVAAASAIGAGLGLGLLAMYLQQESLRGFLSSNELAAARRGAMLGAAGGGGALGLLVFLLFIVWPRDFRAAMERAERFRRLATPLALLFPVPGLLASDAWHSHSILLCCSVLVWGLCFEQSLRPAFALLLDAPLVAAIKTTFFVPLRRVQLGLSIAIAASFTFYFSYYTLQNHWQIQTSSYDLAIFNNMMWNLIRGDGFYSSPVMGWRGSHLVYHATFDAILIAPLYALYQRPEMLLVIQALACGGAILPLFLLARRDLGSGTAALLICLAYAFYPPQHGPIFFDFHFLTITPIFVLWTAYFFDTERSVAFWVALALALLNREDVAPGLMCFFAYQIATKNRVPRAAVGLVVSSIFFVLIKFIIMPRFSNNPGEQSFTYIYKELIPAGEKGFGAVLKTFLLNPLFVLRKVFTEKKLGYVLEIFVPVLFLPLRHGKTLLLLGASIVFTLLTAGYDPMIETHFQYTAHWTSYIFLAAIVALAHLRRVYGAHPAAGAMAMAACAFVLATHLGALNRSGKFRGGFIIPRFTWTTQDAKNLADLRSIIQRIPANATVAASEREAPHVSSRKYCMTLRYGHRDAEWVLLRKEDATGSLRDVMKNVVESGYGHVATEGHFMLWRRGHVSPTTEPLLQELRIPVPSSSQPRVEPANQPAPQPRLPVAPLDNGGGGGAADSDKRGQ
jgi:uncharacterized membrane protein